MDDIDNTHQECEDLRIWQQNLRKSNHTWEHMLKNLNPHVYDIACIQEPYLNPVNLNTTIQIRLLASP
ncbi:hypothetical protein P692DRAFT_20717202 [Suillus brevipes Sb2]|nr:hypothetical protein P692DRAFT_20717202 [Suillus brevipes Sb2]